MQLVRLIEAMMYRDGGTLEATFLDSDGLERSLSLRIGRNDDGVMHHDGLYPCRPDFDDEYDFVFTEAPIPKQSLAEREWLDAISAWIDENPPSPELQAYRSAEVRDPDGDHYDLYEKQTDHDHRLYFLLILFDHIPGRDS